MTEEIQKRIEAIKAGKTPDGYKKAVVGIVPSEWQEKRLSDLLKFQNGVNAKNPVWMLQRECSRMFVI